MFQKTSIRKICENNCRFDFLIKKFPNPASEAQVVMTNVFQFRTQPGGRLHVNFYEADLLCFRVLGDTNRSLICSPRKGQKDRRLALVDNIKRTDSDLWTVSETFLISQPSWLRRRKRTTKT